MRTVDVPEVACVERHVKRCRGFWVERATGVKILQVLSKRRREQVRGQSLEIVGKQRCWEASDYASTTICSSLIGRLDKVDLKYFSDGKKTASQVARASLYWQG